MNAIQPQHEFSDDIPEYYDKYLGPMFFEQYALEIATRIGKRSPSSILELACGTGRLTKLLPVVTAKKGLIVASDINESMVTYAKNNCKDEDIKWMQFDAVELPFNDESFDVVVAQFGVMFYGDRIKAYKETLRVLKKGGSFIFSTWDQIMYNRMAYITNEVLRHFFPVDTPAFYIAPFSYWNRSIITNDLAKAGFIRPNIEVVKLSGYSTSASAASKGLILGTPTISAIKYRNEVVLTALLDELEKRISQEFGNGALNVPLQALIISCNK